ARPLGTAMISTPPAAMRKDCTLCVCPRKVNTIIIASGSTDSFFSAGCYVRLRWLDKSVSASIDFAGRLIRLGRKGAAEMRTKWVASVLWVVVFGLGVIAGCGGGQDGETRLANLPPPSEEAIAKANA